MSVNGRELNLHQQLYAGDIALVAASKEGLRELVKEFGRMCKRWKLRVRRKLRVNARKRKVMTVPGW